ncbi:ephrin type-B receptor 2-like isoform X2 [Watersipora subatra]|uniref:ephrin type-B receptor 2-like isoform X2 n=1 Tax=Watersipora subatra TaxID=2589382 RepID=UPI00355B5C67
MMRSCLKMWITCSVLVCTWLAQHSFAVEVTVLDTLTKTDQLDWTIYPEEGPSNAQNPTWVFSSWNHPITKMTHQGITVCSVADEVVNNWIRLPYINLSGVSNLFINISFFMRECQDYPGPLRRCRTHFNLLKYESDSDIATDSTPAWNDDTYEFLQPVAAANTYINEQSENIVANNFTFSFTKEKKGVYLALQDTGMCAFILSIQVYYRRCPPTVIRHTSLPAVPSTAGLAAVAGTCVANAVLANPSEKLQFLCTHEGDWFNPSNSRGCVCKPGYTNTEDSCIPCEAGKYKSTAANEECVGCPENSESTMRGLAECTCMSGFYRAVDEPAHIACTQPPSEVRSLEVEKLSSNSVTLTWQAPENLGMRADLFYTVLCGRCSTSVNYAPARTKFNSTTVTLTNLVPKSSYVIEIIAENGVSSSAIHTETRQKVGFVTLQSGGDEQQVPMKVVSEPNSLTISWDSVEDAEVYEVVYWPADNRNVHHTTRVYTNYASLTELDAETTYNVQVSYFDANNQLIGRSSEAVFQTDSKSDNPSLMIAIAIVAVLVCMAIVIAIVVIFLRSQRAVNNPPTTESACVSLHKTVLALFRSKQPCTDKPHSDCEGLGPYTNVPFHISSSTGTQGRGVTLPLFTEHTGRVKTYVDPHTYEDPRQAVKEFTKEIDVSCITIEAVIGGGEFGDVCRGKLRIPNKAESEMCVAIKTLKPGASEKNRLEFLTEASIMGQFEDPNVIFLEGVITKSNPIMIVTEYMENGSLDTFLRANDGKLSVMQLQSVLRGIASGMTYLSEMSYIHRDLAARNILVNENLVCKVADFGLSREVEYDTSEGAYTTRGGKIPVRWTAPEAIAFRKFTSASDVWSFGVVMWEVMSYGERPYWNWSNQDVIKAVDRGYRLPPPMECPEAVHQLMLDSWQKDRKNRPKFAAIRNTIDRLMQSPELLTKLAKPMPFAAMDPEMPDVASQMTVSQWLQLIKMDRYTEAFAQKGVHTMKQVAWLTFADLQEMGVTLVGHQKKMMSSVQALRSRLEGGSTSPVQMSEGFLV